MQTLAFRAGVLGAGQMGAGIAATLVRSGFSTTMVDVNQSILEAGSQRAREMAAGRSKTGRADDAESARIASLLSTSTSPAPLADCDVVIEAVTENEAIKTGMFRALAGVLRDEAILASNTSTIPISRMARSWVHPERFAGMHFFHPAQRMELVEVIRGDQTDDQTVTTLVELARRLGKTPIVVRDCPGFLVTRVLFPYLSQAIELLLEGVPMDAIDAAAVHFGMPTGPIALHDFIGLDTVLASSRVMAEGYPDRANSSPLLAEMVRLGRLGQKSGAGFRKHDRNVSHPAADPSFEPLLHQYQHHAIGHSPGKEEITDRLFLPMLLEAIRTVDEGIVREPADVDVGVTLGLGFPASRGGLFAWCDTEGAASIMDRLARYQALGPWFQPT
jgi:3-hydroxyacyl-CoA dehydrogenase / enoyl-CoA hydratase / 3-hydroxybutyryl-CoA epimerase / enoyl-CoA isomerase